MKASSIAFFNFVVSSLTNMELLFQFRTHKVIYRRYAGLFFSMCVDITDNELAYLECIHLFVEILDHFFSNVCELDLVFNFHKVTSMFLG
jgi:AP-2 complex subunit sigma-1